jgi:LuxR family transcriptional regulator, maltose regulon positive regulatory protein
MSGVRTAAGARAPVEIYAHKLFAPPTYAGAIRREAILDRILGSDTARVVVLQGPAGHGKSTSLQQIKSACDVQGWLTGWLSFDEADNDSRRFSIHVQALLGSLSAGDAAAAAGRDADIVESGGRRRSDWLIDRLLKLGRPVGLFLDDLQVLTNKAILTFLKELFERVPENVRVFVGSRSVPEVGLARLVVNRQALILHADDLRFSPAEVEQFFAASRQELEVSREEIDAIYRRTEGWPAALQLFRLTLVSPTVRRSLGDLTSYRPRELAEYLADNVLALQPPRVQEFLLRTSLLTNLSAPLCDAVTGWHGSQELLLQLERSGLFLQSLDSDLHWFRYHGLFSSFLAEQLRAQSPEAADEVHRRAALWHLEHGMHEETVHHAVACRDYSLAADTLNVWCSRMVAGAHLITVERWFDRLPFEEVAKRPDLTIKVAWTLVFLRRQAKLKPLLELMQNMRGGDVRKTTDPSIVLSMAAISTDDAEASFSIIDRAPLRVPEPEGFAAFELGAAANLVGYRAITAGDFEGGREYLALARAYSDRGDSTFSGGYTVGVAGIGLMAQGQLREALRRFAEGMAEQRMQTGKSFASAALVSCYVWALYEANELDLAEALFGQHHDIISESVLPDFFIVAYLSMARTHEARGRAGKALDVLDEAESICHANGWTRLVRTVNWERVRRALLAGALERAQAVAALNPPLPANPAEGRVLFSDDAEGESLSRIRLGVHLLDFEPAAALLAAEFARSKNRVHRQIRLYLLEALLYDRKGSRNLAHRSLRRALQLAEPGRFVRCFLDEGDAVLHLLREEYHNVLESGDGAVAHRAFVEQLLQASGTDLSRTPSAEARPLEPLTEREMEILVFLANGVSNKEMASRIFVSENTVKFHLKNIYSKLAVGSRLQAIATARQIGLIH